MESVSRRSSASAGRHEDAARIPLPDWTIRRSDALGPKQKQQARRNGVEALHLQREILAAWRKIEPQARSPMHWLPEASSWVKGARLACSWRCTCTVALRCRCVEPCGKTPASLAVNSGFISRCEALNSLIKAALAEAEEGSEEIVLAERQRAATAERVSREDWFARMDQTKSAHWRRHRLRLEEARAAAAIKPVLDDAAAAANNGMVMTSAATLATALVMKAASSAKTTIRQRSLAHLPPTPLQSVERGTGSLPHRNQFNRRSRRRRLRGRQTSIKQGLPKRRPHRNKVGALRKDKPYLANASNRAACPPS